MNRFRRILKWLLEPAHLGWQGRLFMSIVAIAALALWFAAVPWYVRMNGIDQGPFSQPIWDPPVNYQGFMGPSRALTSPVPMATETRIAWSSWLGSGIVLVAFTLGIWLIARREARCIRFNRGLCWICGYSRKGLDRDHPCPECGRIQM